MSLGWHNTERQEPRSWTCGYCGRGVGGNVGFKREKDSDDGSRIYICPHCENPTAFVIADDGGIGQYPGPVSGHAVSSLPQDVSALYDEARRCVQYTAYTAAILALRKLLMHVAVSRGADEGQSFASYVAYLADEGWIPPNGKGWVDELRRMGNEANHEIALASQDDAEELLDFAEMLLRFVYEFPGRVPTR